MFDIDGPASPGRAGDLAAMTGAVFAGKVDVFALVAQTGMIVIFGYLDSISDTNRVATSSPGLLNGAVAGEP